MLLELEPRVVVPVEEEVELPVVDVAVLPADVLPSVSPPDVPSGTSVSRSGADGGHGGPSARQPSVPATVAAISRARVAPPSLT